MSSVKETFMKDDNKEYIVRTSKPASGFFSGLYLLYFKKEKVDLNSILVTAKLEEKVEESSKVLTLWIF